MYAMADFQELGRAKSGTVWPLGDALKARRGRAWYGLKDGTMSKYRPPGRPTDLRQLTLLHTGLEHAMAYSLEVK